jgi:hypothetical protein
MGKSSHGRGRPTSRRQESRVAKPTPQRTGSTTAPPPEHAACIRFAEWTFAAAWTFVLLLVLAAPYWHGYRSAGPGWQFAGFVGAYHNDYESYLAWMRQAADGHLLFKDYYTTEPHGRVFMHPVFWLMGTLARSGSVSLLAMWYLVQALACALLIVTVYRFCAYFTDDVATRGLALLLVTTAAGWGWLTSPSDTTPWADRATDLWMAEANEFGAMATSFFTLPLALTFMLLTFLHALLYVDTGRTAEAVWSGLDALALATTHQYDMVTVYGVLAVFAVIAGRRGLVALGVVAAISLPFCLYSFAVVRLDPVFSLHTQAELESPTMAAYVAGWGLPLVLAAVALAVPAVRQRGRDVAFLATWLVVNAGLLAAPIGFERKLMWGIHVPMCLLAAMLVVTGLRRLAAAVRPRAAWAIVLVGALAVTAASAVGNVVLYRSLFERNAEHELGDYLPEEYLDAFRWLDDHGEPGDVVLASLAIAPMIPGRTGCVVFAGHWAQTVDVAGKSEFISALFGPPGSLDLGLIRRVFARNRIRFIVLDRVERDEQDIPPDQSAFAFSPLATKVLGNAFVTIWTVNEGPTGADEAWDGGDWRGPSDGT